VLRAARATIAGMAVVLPDVDRLAQLELHARGLLAQADRLREHAEWANAGPGLEPLVSLLQEHADVLDHLAAELAETLLAMRLPGATA
jgi:hypothetical protein